MLNKILSLRRLPLKHIPATILCRLKRALRADLTPEQTGLQIYFWLLVATDSTCRKLTSSEYLTQRSSGQLVISRPHPSSDLDVFKQIWEAHQYRPVTTLMTETFPYDAPLQIIDAGGNVGYASLYFKECFPNCKIIALEPDVSNYLIMERNFRINKLTNIFSLQAGLWPHRSFLEVRRDSGDAREWAYSVYEVAQPTALLGYGVVDLMTILGWTNIHLLKIDVEGAERYIFNDDASAFLSKTAFVVMEIHDHPGTKRKICNCLSRNYFNYFIDGRMIIATNTKQTAG